METLSTTLSQHDFTLCESNKHLTKQHPVSVCSNQIYPFSSNFRLHYHSSSFRPKRDSGLNSVWFWVRAILNFQNLFRPVSFKACFNGRMEISWDSGSVGVVNDSLESLGRSLKSWRKTCRTQYLPPHFIHTLAPSLKCTQVHAKATVHW